MASAYLATSSSSEDFVLDMKPELAFKVSEEINDPKFNFVQSKVSDNDFRICGFRKRFKQVKLEKFITCSGASCNKIPGPNSYSFCRNNHIFCVQCSTNLTFCWVQGEDRICKKTFYRVEIPLYTNFLTNRNFSCPNRSLGCRFSGAAEYVRKHFTKCNPESSGFPYYCRVTGCKHGAELFEDMTKHLKSRHHSILVQRSVPVLAIRIPWNVPAGVENYLWIPAIVCVSDVYFLIVCRIFYGNFYQFVYVEDKRTSKDEIFIWSGFEIAEKGITHYKEDPPKSLSVPVRKIFDQDCFSINLEDFLENHLMVDESKQSFFLVFDMDIALF